MNALCEQIRERIRLTGPISFAEFMQQALYDPQYGYYSRPAQPIGRGGDFFTSVSVGPFFGELLGFQFARWIESIRQSEGHSSEGVFQCVEAGAHDGRLAFDILESLEKSEPKLFASLEYWIVEPSAARRESQQRTLARFSNVQWFESPAEIHGRVRGVLFSNELFDAMAVHLFRWDAAAHTWNELGVAISKEGLVLAPLLLSAVAAPKLPDELLNVLPNGYTIELSHAAVQWWTDAAMALARGKLMTIDYGGAFEELVSPGRTSGTVRAYSRHHVTQNILANPGEQDITAHVNFSEIRRAGELAGLKTETFTTQSQFLTAIAREFWIRTGSWPSQQVRQFQTLTHPEHLGRPFRVLVQSR